MIKAIFPNQNPSKKRLEISLYERYLLFGKNFSTQIMEQKIQGFNFFGGEREVMFIPGERFLLKQKNGFAVIYSKLLADTIREILALPDDRRAQRLFVRREKDCYQISKDF